MVPELSFQPFSTCGILEGTYSDWLEVSSGVPQGSVLGPILFLLYINNIPSYLLQNSSLMLFSDDSKLYRVINKNSDIISLQEDLTNLHRWSIDSSMTFSTTKCKVLNISRKINSPIRPYVLDGNPLEVVTDTNNGHRYTFYQQFVLVQTYQVDDY